MRLILPYAVSANRYWAHTVRGGRAVTYVTKAAEQYRDEVAIAFARQYGMRKPLTGPVSMTLVLHGPRPQDWQKRLRTEGSLWWLDARCIDLGNAEKVLADALQGIAYVDDKQIVEQHKFRRAPDDQGARVEIYIEEWEG